MKDLRGFGNLGGLFFVYPIILPGAHSMIDFVVKSVQAGAAGYVIKESDSACILKCLDTIAQGKQFIDNSLSEKLCELFVSLDLPAEKESDIPESYGKLSKREREVMRLAVAGKG